MSELKSVRKILDIFLFLIYILFMLIVMVGTAYNVFISLYLGNYLDSDILFFLSLLIVGYSMGVFISYPTTNFINKILATIGAIYVIILSLIWTFKFQGNIIMAEKISSVGIDIEKASILYLVLPISSVTYLVYKFINLISKGENYE